MTVWDAWRASLDDLTRKPWVIPNAPQELDSNLGKLTTFYADKLLEATAYQDSFGKALAERVVTNLNSKLANLEKIAGGLDGKMWKDRLQLTAGWDDVHTLAMTTPFAKTNSGIAKRISGVIAALQSAKTVTEKDLKKLGVYDCHHQLLESCDLAVVKGTFTISEAVLTQYAKNTKMTMILKRMNVEQEMARFAARRFSTDDLPKGLMNKINDMLTS